MSRNVVDPDPEFTDIIIYKLAREDGNFAQNFYWLYRPWAIRSFTLCRKSNRIYYFNPTTKKLRGEISLENVELQLIDADHLRSILNGNVPPSSESDGFQPFVITNLVNNEIIYLAALDKETATKCGRILYPAAGMQVPAQFVDEGVNIQDMCVITSPSEKIIFQVLLCSLNGSGKTVLFHKLTNSRPQGKEVSPTLELQVDEMVFGMKHLQDHNHPLHQQLTVLLWDVPGAAKARNEWSNYVQGKQMLLFAVDATAPERFGEAKEALHKLVQEVGAEVFVVVVASKQEMAGAKSCSDIEKGLSLSKLSSGRRHQIKVIGGAANDQLRCELIIKAIIAAIDNTFRYEAAPNPTMEENQSNDDKILPLLSAQTDDVTDPPAMKPVPEFCLNPFLGALIYPEGPLELSFANVVMLSLDDAGKTTLFNRLIYSDIRETSTTIGFNVDTMSTFEHRLVTLWDLGGRKELRPLWQPYVDTAHMILFPIDVSNGERMEEAQQELVRVVTELCPRENVPVLLIAMKRDKENAMSMEELYARMSGILKPVMQGSQSSRVIEYVPYAWNNEEDKHLILNWIGFNARQHCNSTPPYDGWNDGPHKVGTFDDMTDKEIDDFLNVEFEDIVDVDRDESMSEVSSIADEENFDSNDESGLLGVLKLAVSVVSLDDAGKTTLIRTMVNGEIFTPMMPTMGFDLQILRPSKREEITVWDHAGHKAYRPLLKQYLPSTQAIIFPVDSSSSERLEEAKQELFRIATEVCPYQMMPILVVSTKQDKQGAINCDEMWSKLAVESLKELQPHRVIDILPSDINCKEHRDAIVQWLRQFYS